MKLYLAYNDAPITKATIMAVKIIAPMSCVQVRNESPALSAIQVNFDFIQKMA